MTRLKLLAERGKIHHEFIFRDLSKALSVRSRYNAKNFYTTLLTF